MQASMIVVLFVVIVPCLCQRSFYAGTRGYPDIYPVAAKESSKDDLPPALNGDTAYADRLNKLPEDQRPFWYLNREHYKALMNKPQTYPQRPSVFNENSG